MTTRKPGSDGPEDVDAAFAEIIADLEREGIGKDVEAAALEATMDPGPATEPAMEPPEPPADELAPGWRVADQEWDWDGEDEHYEPPEPPPLPRLHGSTIVALLLVAIALLLFIAPGILGLQSTAAIPIATIAVVGAAALLLLRLRTGNPPGSPGSDDDGARL